MKKQWQQTVCVGDEIVITSNFITVPITKPLDKDEKIVIPKMDIINKTI